MPRLPGLGLEKGMGGLLERYMRSGTIKGTTRNNAFVGGATRTNVFRLLWHQTRGLAVVSAPVYGAEQIRQALQGHRPDACPVSLVWVMKTG